MTSRTIAVLLALALGACDNYGQSSLDHLDGGSCECVGVDAPPPTTTVTISGLYWDWKAGKPNLGTSVCLRVGTKKTATCTKPNTIGLYSVDVPANTPIVLDFEKPGYQHITLALQLESDLSFDAFGAHSDAEAKMFYAKANAAYPPTTKGDLVVNCAAGATVEISPESGSDLHCYPKGPILRPSPYNPETDDVMAFGLASGKYTVNCKHANLTCLPMTGWPSAAGGVEVPVIAGTLAVVMFGCMDL